jgi:uncharacterized protein
MSELDTERPWYRESWPWLLMIPPLASVIVGFVLLYFAIEVPNPLAVDDYADIEEINSRQFARDEAASTLSLTADVAFETSDDGRVDVSVSLFGSNDFMPPSALELRLQHVANSSADRRLTLIRRGSRYVGTTTLAVGRYDLELLPADETWRLAGPVPGVPSATHLEAAAPRS